MTGLAVSIVMPARDAAAHIGEALESIAAQASDAPGGLEVIVADGGSRDTTRAIAAGFQFVRVLDGPDGGIYQGFNRALAAARMPHVGFVNADDILPEGALRAVAAGVAAAPDADMLSGDAEFASSDGAALIRRVQDGPMSLAGLLFGIPAINARFFRREVLIGSGGFRPDAGIAADRELLVRLHVAGLRGRRVEATLCRYRMHGGSTTISGDAAGRRRVWKAEVDLAGYLLGDAALPAGVHRLARRSQALATMKQHVAARSLRGLDAPTLAELPAALLEWRRWRARLSGF
jgi:glycosyltransferase involved in cell wall biosynthesis